MRNRPRVITARPGRNYSAPPHVPPPCREVVSHIPGLSESMTRVDIIADDEVSPEPQPEPQPGTEGAQWATLDDALNALRSPPRPDPWARLDR